MDATELRLGANTEIVKVWNGLSCHDVGQACETAKLRFSSPWPDECDENGQGVSKRRNKTARGIWMRSATVV